MLVGSRSTFATEFVVEDSRDSEGQSWQFGHICFWAGGMSVGNYDELASLSVAIPAMSELLRYQGSRMSADLSMSPSEIFYRIDDALYVEDRRSDQQVEADWNTFARYIATPVGLDVFDGWKAFIIEDERSGRYVWKETRREESEVLEAHLAAGEFDEAIKTSVAYLKDL